MANDFNDLSKLIKKLEGEQEGSILVVQYGESSSSELFQAMGALEFQNRREIILKNGFCKNDPVNKYGSSTPTNSNKIFIRKDLIQEYVVLPPMFKKRAEEYDSPTVSIRRETRDSTYDEQRDSDYKSAVFNSVKP